MQDPESTGFSACWSVQAPGNQPQGGERLRARGRHGLWGGCEEPLPGTSTPVPSAQASQLCGKRPAQRVSLRHQRLRAESGLRRAGSGADSPTASHPVQPGSKELEESSRSTVAGHCEGPLRPPSAHPGNECPPHEVWRGLNEFLPQMYLEQGLAWPPCFENTA